MVLDLMAIPMEHEEVHESEEPTAGPLRAKAKLDSLPSGSRFAVVANCPTTHSCQSSASYIKVLYKYKYVAAQDLSATF